MPARDQQSHERWLRLGVLEHRAEEVRLHVVHRDQGLAQRVGGGLGPTHSHEERADEAGAGRDAEDVHPGERHPGLRQGLVHDGVDLLEVGPGGQLGHDPPEHLVHVLREDDVSQETVAAVQDRRGRLVARGLDAQHDRARRAIVPALKFASITAASKDARSRRRPSISLGDTFSAAISQ